MGNKPRVWITLKRPILKSVTRLELSPPRINTPPVRIMPRERVCKTLTLVRHKKSTRVTNALLRSK